MELLINTWFDFFVTSFRVTASSTEKRTNLQVLPMSGNEFENLLHGPSVIDPRLTCIVGNFVFFFKMLFFSG